MFFINLCDAYFNISSLLSDLMLSGESLNKFIVNGNICNRLKVQIIHYLPGNKFWFVNKLPNQIFFIFTLLYQYLMIEYRLCIIRVNLTYIH